MKPKTIPVIALAIAVSFGSPAALAYSEEHLRAAAQPAGADEQADPPQPQAQAEGAEPGVEQKLESAQNNGLAEQKVDEAGNKNGLGDQKIDQTVYKGVVGNLLEAVPMDAETRVDLQRANAVVGTPFSARSLALLLGITNPVVMVGGLIWGIWAASQIEKPKVVAKEPDAAPARVQVAADSAGD